MFDLTFGIWHLALKNTFSAVLLCPLVSSATKEKGAGLDLKRGEPQDSGHPLQIPSKGSLVEPTSREIAGGFYLLAEGREGTRGPQSLISRGANVQISTLNFESSKRNAECRMPNAE